MAAVETYGRLQRTAERPRGPEAHCLPKRHDARSPHPITCGILNTVSTIGVLFAGSHRQPLLSVPACSLSFDGVWLLGTVATTVSTLAMARSCEAELVEYEGWETVRSAGG